MFSLGRPLPVSGCKVPGQVFRYLSPFPHYSTCQEHFPASYYPASDGRDIQVEGTAKAKEKKLSLGTSLDHMSELLS